MNRSHKKASIRLKNENTCQKQAESGSATGSLKIDNANPGSSESESAEPESVELEQTIGLKFDDEDLDMLKELHEMMEAMYIDAEQKTLQELKAKEITDPKA